VTYDDWCALTERDEPDDDEHDINSDFESLCATAPEDCEHGDDNEPEETSERVGAGHRTAA
jgi:hypothetical protein